MSETDYEIRKIKSHLSSPTKGTDGSAARAKTGEKFPTKMSSPTARQVVDSFKSSRPAVPKGGRGKVRESEGARTHRKHQSGQKPAWVRSDAPAGVPLLLVAFERGKGRPGGRASFWTRRKRRQFTISVDPHPFCKEGARRERKGSTRKKKLYKISKRRNEIGPESLPTAICLNCVKREGKALGNESRLYRLS